MFPPEIKLIFSAQTALHAAQQKDPRFEILVTRLMERCTMSREQVITSISLLAKGNVHI